MFEENSHCEELGKGKDVSREGGVFEQNSVFSIVPLISMFLSHFCPAIIRPKIALTSKVRMPDALPRRSSNNHEDSAITSSSIPRSLQHQEHRLGDRFHGACSDGVCC